jgi:Domain of unknown function (DUF4372)/Transposase DDE domain
MNVGKTLFAQLMDFLPWSTFARLVERYGGDHRVRTLTCAEQYRAMAFAQLTFRESLRDIETVFLTNQRTLPAATICALYKCRWQVELFFKDQTAPKNQSVLRHNRERSEVANMGRGLGLRPRRHREDAPGPRRSPLHFATGSFADPLRKNAHSTGSFAGSPSN